MKKLARGLAKLIFGNEGLSGRLERVAWVQALAKHLRVRELMNAGLARHPIRRTLPGSGVRYSVETFETLAVERSYFGNPAFAALFAGDPPATFIDLGCNSGIFPCFLTHLRHGSPPRGFCVDANDVPVELARKNVALNGWPDVHVLCGLVGSTHADGDASEFFLAPTSLGSSQFAYQETKSGHPIDWKRIVVPTLQVAPTWTRLVGADIRCGCLKIDIEGSEMSFLRQESAFLACVDTILLEWHVWATTRDEVVRFLEQHEFRLDCIVEDEPRNGVLFFKRTDASGGADGRR
jgi:FkbM family methyltransferase